MHPINRKSINVIHDAQLHELIGKYLAGELLEGEKQQLFTWVEASAENRAFFEEMVSIWSAAEVEEAPLLEVNTEEAWGQLESMLQLDTEAELPVEATPAPAPLKVAHRSDRILRWSIAASIILLVGALVTFWPSGTVEAPLLASTADGQRTEVQLEDGSTVWLNERSELRFAWNDGERRVELTGEAFFEVVKMPDQPFVILAGDTETRVLGTSFNLRAYPEEEVVELDVETGLVSFTQASKPEEGLKIPAGKGAVAKATGLEEEEKSINAQGWRINELQYKDTPMAQVVAELEKQYEISLVVENAATLLCPISVRLRRQSLEEDLKAVLFFLDGSLEVIEEEKIYKLLNTKSCE